MANSQTYLNSYRISDPTVAGASFTVQAAKGSGGVNNAQSNNVTLSDGTSTGSTQAGENFNFLGDVARDAVNNGVNNGTSTYIGYGSIGGVQGVIVFDPNGQGGSGYFILTGVNLSVGASGTATLASANNPATWWSLGGTATPAAPTGIAFRDNVGTVQGSFGSGTRSDDTTPTLSGTAGAGSTIKIFVNGGASPVASVNATASGTWSWTPATPLTQGTYNYTATETSTAGTTSAASSAFTIVVDTTAPAAPVIGGVADNAAPVIGPVGNGGATNDTTLTLTGTAEAGATIKILNGMTQVGTTIADGSGNWAATTSALSDGSASLTVTATDAAGNTSVASAARSFTIDTAAPAMPAIGLVSDNVGIARGALLNGASTDDNTLTLSGTAEAGSTIKILNGGTQVGTASVDGSGNWTATTSALPDGSATLTVTATDAAGNISTASAARSFTIDTVAPAETTTIALAHDTGVAGDGLTHDATLGGNVSSLLAGIEIVVKDGAAILGTATTGANGAWSFTPGGAAAADGSHTYSAAVTDMAGNLGPSAATSPAVTMADTAGDADVVVEILDVVPGMAPTAHFNIVGLDVGSTARVTFTGSTGGSVGYDIGSDGGHDAELSGLVGTVDAQVLVTDSAGNVASGAGDSETDEPVCFYPGTLIATPGGAVPVERLRAADLVLTMDGRAEPVRWLGRQTVHSRFGDPLRILPVRIRAGALAEHLPSRDLLVSPAHALLVEGVLVQAGALVNGRSIVRERDVPEIFTY